MTTEPRTRDADEYEWVALGVTSVFGGLLIRWWRSADHTAREPHNPVLTASAEGVTVGHLVTLHSIPDQIMRKANDAFDQLAHGRADLARQHITHHYERTRDDYELVKGATA